ncbi:MAG: hypothetical protein FD153_1758 [Rhodospirillaceae bacterium]|nr:MAG: hypothetical protein FD153_1758 [Rhodospirillaceae bacterium]
MSDQAGQMNQTNQTNRRTGRQGHLRHLVAMALAAAVLYGGWWVYAAATVKRDLAAWATRQRGPGVRYGSG